MFYFLFLLVLCAVLTEALTELFVKSDFFVPIRSIFVKIPFVKYIAVCGYCASVWMAIPGALVLTDNDRIINDVPIFFTFLFYVLVLHRLSNYLHCFVDRWLDKFYLKS
jgi:hypothetical protein